MGMTNKTLTIDCNKEYTNIPLDIGGIRQIKLGYRPAGVEVWISTENTGDNLYKLENKGDGWINLPEVLENCYITTKGTNVDDKLVLYYSGDYSDFYATGNAVTGRINEVESLKNIADSVLYKLHEILYLNKTDNIVYANFVNASVSKKYSGDGTFLGLSLLCDFASVKFVEKCNYMIEIQGHVDFGSYNTNDIGDTTWNAGQKSIHFDLINKESIQLKTNFNDESASQTNAPNFYTNKNTKGLDIENMTNHATLWGGTYNFNGHGAIDGTSGSHWGFNVSYSNANTNFKESYIINGHLMNKLNALIISQKLIRSGSQSNALSYHCSFKIVIRKMQNIANQPIITSLPYINNDV